MKNLSSQILKRIFLPLMFVALFCVQGSAQIIGPRPIYQFPTGMVIHSTSGSNMGYWGEQDVYSIIYPKAVAPGTGVKMVLEGFGPYNGVEWYVSMLGQEILLTGQTSPTLIHRLDSEAQNYTMTYKARVSFCGPLNSGAKCSVREYVFRYSVKSKL